jgi:hypothetical protein
MCGLCAQLLERLRSTAMYISRVYTENVDFSYRTTGCYCQKLIRLFLLNVEVQARNRGRKRKCQVLVGEVSLHTETAMRIAEMMLDNILFPTNKVEGGGILMVARIRTRVW